MNAAHDAFEEAQRYIPGGVNSPVRAFRGVGGDPLFVERAQGPYLYATDGRSYIDYVGSWGPMVLGHAHPEVIAAVQEAAARGLSFGTPTLIETAMAKRLCELVPSLELVRMVSSGTEATMSAIRLARGYTGRDRILKFEGCYHGHSDSLLVKAGSGALTLGVPSSPGVPACLAEQTLTASFNDSDQVRMIFAEYGEALAGVIVEPVAGNMNCVPPIPGFLETLREQCSRYRSVLIFDEVMTGFRVASGGAQAGTLSGNPVAMTAGLKTLELVAVPGFFDRLTQLTCHLTDGLVDRARHAGIPLTCQHVGGMFGLFFTTEPVISRFDQVMACDQERFRRFFHGMLDEGIYLAPSAFEAGFVSVAHEEPVIARTFAAAERVFRRL